MRDFLLIVLPGLAAHVLAGVIFWRHQRRTEREQELSLSRLLRISPSFRQPK